MTKEQALNHLRSGNQHERFTAAHVLMRLADENDLIFLLRARHFETDAFVKNRLEAAINHLNTQRTKASRAKPKPPPIEDKSYVRSSGVETSNMLLHEVGSKLGLIALTAKREVPNYEVSQTFKYIKHLQAVFDAIEQLKSISASPKIEEFDLFELIDEVVVLELQDIELDILRVGLRPIIVKGDRNFIELALCNGLRNSIEAVTGMENSEDQEKNNGDRHESIVISWGKTDKDYWISIIDSGPGLPNKNVFNEAGKSTKSGHSGYGLQISKQAMERLNGTLSLTPSNAGGAIYTIRWGRI